MREAFAFAARGPGPLGRTGAIVGVSRKEGAAPVAKPAVAPAGK